MQRSIFTLGAALTVLSVVGLALFGSFVQPSDPNDGQLLDALSGPSSEHWLGTDYLGRDTLSRLIAGCRVAMIAGFEATLVALILGLSIGLVIGLAGGWADRVTMRVIDGVSAIPALVLAIAIIAALGAGLTRSMLAVGIAFATSMTRLVRGLTLSERERLYVDGARIIGASRWRLLRNHIAPNIAGPIAVQATLVFASAITIEAGLSFLGLGVQPPNASWGGMLANAQRTVREVPFQAVPPGLAIVVTVLSINILGDAAIRRRRGESSDHPTGYLEPVPVQLAPNPLGSTADSSDPGSTDTSRSQKPPMLEAHNICVRYGQSKVVAGVSISLEAGEVVALVGESGSGKTTVAMTLAGLQTPPATVTAQRLTLTTESGVASLIGDRATHASWRSAVGVVFQEPAASLNPLQTVGRQLRDVLRAQRASSGAQQSKAADREHILSLLHDVGLPDPGRVARLRPDQISGGMAQRVVIALALAKEPALLIADEPTTALDVTVQAEIVRLLRDLCERRHFAVLLVTHDLGVAAELADTCHVMFQGRVLETAPMKDLITQPLHPYTAALIAAVPQNVPGRPILGLPAKSNQPRPEFKPAHTDPFEFNDSGPPTGSACAYTDRCPYVQAACRTSRPSLAVVAGSRSRRVACFEAMELHLDGAGTPQIESTIP